MDAPCLSKSVARKDDGRTLIYYTFRRRALSAPVPDSTRLPLQPSLDHRGPFTAHGPPLFPPPGTLEAIGGRDTVARLVDGLYDRIEGDGLLRPVFRTDLTTERERLKEFFEVWLDGRPHPVFDGEWTHELKRAHEHIPISRGMADRWVGHFLGSFAETVHDPTVIDRIEPLISRYAAMLVNRPQEPTTRDDYRKCCGSPEVQRLTGMVRRDDGESIMAAGRSYPQGSLPKGATLLLIAAVRGKARAAEALLRLGVDANAPAILPGSEASLHGLPTMRLAPLCGALVKRRDAVVTLLVAHGAQYDIFTAAFAGDLDAVRNLLESDPDLVDARDSAYDLPRVTPLLHAVYAGQLEVARFLLQRGATLGLNSGKLVLGAANAGHEALVDLLFEHGAEGSTIGPGPWVIHPDIAEKLLARGADVNAWPAHWIWYCCTGNSGHKENEALARGMLRCGADVNALYRERTALHHAAKAGFTKVVAALIEYGGDVNALDDRGRTPLDAVEEAARSIDREPVRRLLIAHGARPGAT